MRRVTFRSRFGFQGSFCVARGCVWLSAAVEQDRKGLPHDASLHLPALLSPFSPKRSVRHLRCLPAALPPFSLSSDLAQGHLQLGHLGRDIRADPTAISPPDTEGPSPMAVRYRSSTQRRFSTEASAGAKVPQVSPQLLPHCHHHSSFPWVFSSPSPSALSAGCQQTPLPAHGHPAAPRVPAEAADGEPRVPQAAQQDVTASIPCKSQHSIFFVHTRCVC